MDPWPHASDLQQLYKQDNIFSVNRKTFAIANTPTFPEKVYRRYGSDDRFIVKTCMKLSRNQSSRRVLDVGCSTGRLLSAFHMYDGNLELHGIDIDPGAKDLAPEWLHDNVIIGNFLEHDFVHKFDIITMKFVIEHLTNPNAFIERASKLLNKNGVLFISTPDIASPKARLQSVNWHSLNEPNIKTGHILWFNRDSLMHLGQRAGLDIMHCTNRGELIYHLPAPVRSILFHIFGKTPAGHFINANTLRLLYASLFDGVLSEKLDYGDSLYAFFSLSR